jgi:hypothetical protein
VNQIVHASNGRLDHDIEICIKHEVPITITSAAGGRGEGGGFLRAASSCMT